MRSPFALTVLLVCRLPSLAADEKVLHDCEYWLLGKDKSEQGTLLKACDRIIAGKGFSKADRAMATRRRLKPPVERNVTTMLSRT